MGVLINLSLMGDSNLEAKASSLMLSDWWPIPKILEDARLRQTSEGPEHSSTLWLILNERSQHPRSFKDVRYKTPQINITNHLKPSLQDSAFLIYKNSRALFIQRHIMKSVCMILTKTIKQNSMLNANIFISNAAKLKYPYKIKICRRHLYGLTKA